MTDNQVAIRTATEADIPRILELYRQLALTPREAEEQTGCSTEDYRLAFTEIDNLPGYELVVAEDEGIIIGSLMLAIVPNLSHGARPWAVIENVIVDEAYRRFGVGRRLMEYAAGRAREAGCYKVGLTSTRSGRSRPA